MGALILCVYDRKRVHHAPHYYFSSAASSTVFGTVWQQTTAWFFQFLRVILQCDFTTGAEHKGILQRQQSCQACLAVCTVKKGFEYWVFTQKNCNTHGMCNFKMSAFYHRDNTAVISRLKCRPKSCGFIHVHTVSRVQQTADGLVRSSSSSNSLIWPPSQPDSLDQLLWKQTQLSEVKD